MSTTLRRIAIGALATVHALGVLGAPFAAKMHVFQAGATAHQNFHVVWEAFKYFTASALAFVIAVVPLRRGEPWAWWAMLVATGTLFGGVFIANALTGGAPKIDIWSYGTFLVLSVASLAVTFPFGFRKAHVENAAPRARPS